MELKVLTSRYHHTAEAEVIIGSIRKLKNRTLPAVGNFDTMKTPWMKGTVETTCEIKLKAAPTTKMMKVTKVRVMNSMTMITTTIIRVVQAPLEPPTDAWLI